MKRYDWSCFVVSGVAALWGACLAGIPALAEDFDRKAYDQAIERELARMDSQVEEGPYKADWDSLKEHNEAPEWFRDAKFGIYFHWGVYSVPAYGNEWYPKWMHAKQGRRSYYQHHVETYGEPDRFGYHDFVPMLKAEHFDAEDWADLFEKAGARYAGPVCEHHDGYSMWDSDVTPWNAADTGPKRDITGELEKAIRSRGMKFVTTFHHERTRNWYPRVEGWPTTSDDPKLQLLYMNIPEELFDKVFQAKLGEVIDRYQPDLIWFDGRLEEIPDPYHRRFLAYYFDRAKQWGRDVVVTCKGHDYPPEVAVEDFEKGRMDHLTDFCWLTDDTISLGSWCYTQDLQIKPTSRVLHDFIDIVSKNGCLLLNISPKADGTIPQNQRQVLLDMGQWLKVNGEAIYNTRPWLAHGEGPTRLGKSGGFVGAVTYTPQDIRYTRSKDGRTLYAIVLGWPETGKLTPQAVVVENADGAAVELLGYGEPVKFSVGPSKQLTIDVPQLGEGQRPCRFAYVFKLTGFETGLDSEAIEAAAAPLVSSKAAVLSKDLTLDATEAGLVGSRIRLEQKIDGQNNIGHWNNAREKAEWKVQIGKPGAYALSAVIAAVAESRLSVDVAGTTLSADVPATGGFVRQQTIELGQVTIDKAGVYPVVARPASQSTWKAVNVWKLELTPAP